MEWITVIGFLAWIGFLVTIMIRNRRVYDFQMDLLKEVRVAAQDDIKCIFVGKHYDFQWRYDTLNAYNYNKMVILFWKPLRSFYDNYDFTDPKVKREAQ